MLDGAAAVGSYAIGEYTPLDRTMPAPDISAVTHSHQFNHVDANAERNTRRVVYITAAMMVVEIVGGYWLNSMALLADGWHMSSHALAMGLSVIDRKSNTSELQSLMRISYAVFCLKKKKKNTNHST